MAKTMNNENMKINNSNDKAVSDSHTEEYKIEKDGLTEESMEPDSIDIAQLRTPIKVDLSVVYDFLGARTTQAWVEAAIANVPLIIQDRS